LKAAFWRNAGTLFDRFDDVLKSNTQPSTSSRSTIPANCNARDFAFHSLLARVRFHWGVACARYASTIAFPVLTNSAGAHAFNGLPAAAGGTGPEQTKGKRQSAENSF
jgi:hypothetical protein